MAKFGSNRKTGSKGTFPLDDPNVSKAVDPGGMISAVEGFADQAREGWDLAAGVKMPCSIKDIDQILVCGMGGSAIAGDLIRCYLRDAFKKPVLVNREYTLPAWVGKRTLVVASSYSGNTEESLAAYSQACQKKAKILAITTGGDLAKKTAKAKQTQVAIPGGLQPRAALGYGFFPLLRVLDNSKWIPSQKKAMAETLDLLAKTCRMFALKRPTNLNPAKKVAVSLAGKLTVVYAASDPYEAVATRWRGQLEENAKVLAFCHTLPEMNHNEIVGWEHDPGLWKKIHVILLRDPEAEHPRTALRFQVIRRLLKGKPGQLTPITAKGKGLLARTFFLINFGDFTSVYLAYLNKQDPTPVAPIAKLKKVLASKK